MVKFCPKKETLHVCYVLLFYEKMFPKTICFICVIVVWRIWLSNNLAVLYVLYVSLFLPLKKTPHFTCFRHFIVLCNFALEKTLCFICFIVFFYFLQKKHHVLHVLDVLLFYAILPGRKQYVLYVLSFFLFPPQKTPCFTCFRCFIVSCNFALEKT